MIDFLVFEFFAEHYPNNPAGMVSFVDPSNFSISVPETLGFGDAGYITLTIYHALTTLLSVVGNSDLLRNLESTARGKRFSPVNRGSGKSGTGKSGTDYNKIAKFWVRF